MQTGAQMSRLSNRAKFNAILSNVAKSQFTESIFSLVFPLLTHKMPDVVEEGEREKEWERMRQTHSQSALEIGAESTVN